MEMEVAESALDEMQAIFEALEEAESDLVSRTTDTDLSQVQNKRTSCTESVKVNYIPI